MIRKLIGKLSPQRRNRILLEIRETNLAARLFFRETGFRAISVLAILRRYARRRVPDAVSVSSERCRAGSRGRAGHSPRGVKRSAEGQVRQATRRPERVLASRHGQGTENRRNSCRNFADLFRPTFYAGPVAGTTYSRTAKNWRRCQPGQTGARRRGCRADAPRRRRSLRSCKPRRRPGSGASRRGDGDQDRFDGDHGDPAHGDVERERTAMDRPAAESSPARECPAGPSPRPRRTATSPRGRAD